MSPIAELADLILPAASFWESWHVGVNHHHTGDKVQVQLRPAAVAPSMNHGPT